MTLLYSDRVFLKHDTGPHPERPQRLAAITQMLERSGLVSRCTPGEFGLIEEREVERVHAPALVRLVSKLAAEGGGATDPDTVVSADSFRVALAAAGACTAAVDAVLVSQDQTALCLVRPPGHHATATQSMGFCLFNNVALAARRALDRHQLERVLVVDWDVHHGNGTQDIYYNDPRVLFYSIHRYGHGFYPGSGAADETGSGPGLGYTINVPVAYGTPRQHYRAAFLTGLHRAADRIKPQLVLLSAGFDAHVRDPIGSLGLETEDFQTLTQAVLEVAGTHCGGRLISCLEGGYDLSALAESVQVHLEKLLGVRDLGLGERDLGLGPWTSAGNRE